MPSTLGMFLIKFMFWRKEIAKDAIIFLPNCSFSYEIFDWEWVRSKQYNTKDICSMVIKLFLIALGSQIKKDE